MGYSVLDEVYVALRNLLRARFVSPATREQALKIVKEMNKEALAKTILDTTDDDTSSAAD